MKEEYNVIKILADIGVSKETTLDIMRDLLDNASKYASKYANNQEAIDDMLQDKLGIDLYIAMNNYKGI